VESILGLSLRADDLVVDPCIPRGWSSFKLTYRDGATTTEILVENPRHVSRGVLRVELDGRELPDRRIPRLRDGATHHARVTLGEPD
jgi:cyclic beta-1,2-glucan synthetase